MPKNQIQFVFDADIFTAGQKPLVLCSSCGAEGHLQQECPDERLPELRPRPVMSAEQHMLLEKACEEVMQRYQPTRFELDERKRFVTDLTRFIRKHDPTARLTVFGSSHNGFAFSNSDLDISLTFDDHPDEKTIDAIAVIEKLAERCDK